MDNVIIRVVSLPYTVRGVTIPHPDGTYNIYINDKYSVETQNKILQHELRHIKNFDFDNFDNIRFIEQRANAV